MGLLLVIIGMALVTYIPRVLPAFLLEAIEFKPWLDKWLRAIPFAALGALIIPGIFTVEPGAPYVGIAGGLVAALVAYMKGHMIFVILAAVATVYILQMYLGG